MPAWHHGSEVEAARVAGAECVFYPLTSDLDPDAHALERVLTPDVAALHLTHFLGFPQDAAWWRRWCDARGLALVEDAAQAWPATRDGVPVGSAGDLAVWCLYKTCGLPDGAVVRGPPSLGGIPDGGAGWGQLAGRHRAWLAQRLPVRRRRPARSYDHAADIRVGDPIGPAALTRRLLARVDAEEAARHRRAHYRRYLDVLGDLVPRPFRRVPDGAAPFVFPVCVRDKPAVLRLLRRRGVGALDLWSVPHPLLPPALDPLADRLRAHLVGLPVHQGLGVRGARGVVRATQAVVAELDADVHRPRGEAS